MVNSPFNFSLGHTHQNTLLWPIPSILILGHNPGMFAVVAQCLIICLGYIECFIKIVAQIQKNILGHIILKLIIVAHLPFNSFFALSYYHIRFFFSVQSRNIAKNFRRTISGHKNSAPCGAPFAFFIQLFLIVVEAFA